MVRFIIFLTVINTLQKDLNLFHAFRSGWEFAISPFPAASKKLDVYFSIDDETTPDKGVEWVKA